MTLIKESENQNAAVIHYRPDTSGCPVECLPDLIRKYAYQIFEARGRQPGHELEDWLQAERELKRHLNL